VKNHILQTAVYTVLILSTFAGEKPVKTITEPEKPSPLSFANGLLTFDIQDRVRWEYKQDNFDFNDSVRTINDDNWVLNRLRIGLAIKPAPWLKIYAQTQDAREWLSDRPDFPGVFGADGDDTFDLRQAYIEIADYTQCPWGLKIGRQVLEYGDERLIGPADWTNLSRTFDAVKLTYRQKDWSIDAFAGTVVVPTRGKFNQSDFLNGTETGREQIFSGIYFTTKALDFQTTELYALYLHENLSAPATLFTPAHDTDTNFFTLGVRAKSTPGKLGPWDYELEAAYQVGDVKGKDLSAFAGHIAAGYNFNAAWKPRLGLEYNYATGDNDPLDGDTETFQNLFPSNHKFYGFMDVFAWQNVHDLSLGLKFTPVKDVTVRTDFHAFWLASNDDVWYRANGSTAVRPLTPAARGASNYAGSELDVVVSWKARKELTFEMGYSHFFAGDYLGDTGTKDDADFAYVQATFSL
jgi:hypothetical protein